MLAFREVILFEFADKGDIFAPMAMQAAQCFVSDGLVEIRTVHNEFFDFFILKKQKERVNTNHIITICLYSLY